METYSDGIWMRMDAVNDQTIERSLKLQVGYLSLLKMQPESWDFAYDARCG
jgi:hypothetical protein